MTEPSTNPASVRAMELAALLRRGNDSQRERHAANLLPEDELTALARAELFDCFKPFRRWAGRDREALIGKIRHANWCGGVRHIDTETTEVTEIGAEEWEALKQITTIADAQKTHPWLAYSIDPISILKSTHWATCSACKAEVCRSSAKITIRWAGRELVREYAL